MFHVEYNLSCQIILELVCEVVIQFMPLVFCNFNIIIDCVFLITFERNITTITKNITKLQQFCSNIILLFNIEGIVPEFMENIKVCCDLFCHRERC